MRENDMTVMTSWDLFDDLRSAQDEMLRASSPYSQRLVPLSQFARQFGGPDMQAWAPPVEITERKDAYLVAVELPGVGIEDLEITFQDGLLTIQGERHPAHDPAAEKVHRAERRYGAFRRSITLPSHVMADAIEATAWEGVLQILVPKAKEVRAKRIPVRGVTGKAAAAGKAAVTSKAAKNGA
jgi:HSP20 family protein